MKIEFTYLIVILVLSLSGFFYKHLFLSGTIEKTQDLIEKNGDVSAKLFRDSLVQINIDGIKSYYLENKRDSRKYGEVIVEILSFTEDLLKKSGVSYKVNDINQDIDEVYDYKNGKTTFFINVRFVGEHKSVKDLLVSIEKSQNIIDISEFEVTRQKVDLDESKKKELDSAGLEFDEYNENAKLNVKLRLEFVKFL